MRNALVVGTRVYLRPLEASDATELAWHSATETETFMERWRSPASPLAFEHWINEQVKQRPPESVSLAICLIDDDTLLGDVNLVDIDWVHRHAETGSWIGRAEFRGQGYGTEAKHLLLEYAFDHLHLHVLSSWVWEPNTRSAAALMKQGYQPAGRVKWDDIQHGVFRDALLFDVLRDEWLAARDVWRGNLTPPAPLSREERGGQEPEFEGGLSASNTVTPSPNGLGEGAGG